MIGPPVTQQAVCSQLKQLRHRFQVPVGFVHVHMPEIGCQLGEFPFDIEPRSVPMDQRARGKSVAHIMEPWTTAMAFRDGTEAKLLG
jgi:cytolysin (calcineurin-like family phosphatase)